MAAVSYKGNNHRESVHSDQNEHLSWNFKHKWKLDPAQYWWGPLKQKNVYAMMEHKKHDTLKRIQTGTNTG